MNTLGENLCLTLTLGAPDLDEASLEQTMRGLLRELRAVDEVERAELQEGAPQAGISKSGGGTEPGGLWAWVKGENLEKFIAKLREMLGGRDMEMEIELPDGGKLKIKTKHPEDFAAAAQKAQKLLTAARRKGS
jgi:hypothetical protein